MTFGAKFETGMFEHLFGVGTCPVFTEGWLALSDSYPGEMIIDNAIGRGAWQVTADDFSSAVDSEIVNTASFLWEAIADWPDPVGGWIIYPELPPEDSKFFFIAGTALPQQSIYAGEQVHFTIGSMKIVQNGREPTARGHFTNYTENKFLDYVFGKTAFSKPDIYIGLLTADPTEAGTNDDCNELPLVGSYSRFYAPPVGWTVLQWPAWGGVFNKLKISFAEATSNWGIIRYIGIFDTESQNDPGGHLLMYIPLTFALDIRIGYEAYFNAAPSWDTVVLLGALYFRFSY